jgi:hypothetical protein
MPQLMIVGIVLDVPKSQDDSKEVKEEALDIPHTGTTPSFSQETTSAIPDIENESPTATATMKKTLRRSGKSKLLRASVSTPQLMQREEVGDGGGLKKRKSASEVLIKDGSIAGKGEKKGGDKGEEKEGETEIYRSREDGEEGVEA